MSVDEIMWRCQSLVRDTLDRPRFALGWYPSPSTIGSSQLQEGKPPRFRVSDMAVGEWASPASLSVLEGQWRQRLLAEADLLVQHRFKFFNLNGQHLGDPIDWNRDHAAGIAAPMRFAPTIDYRDYRVTGDAKMVWEPNRHQHLVVLGRAYRASGELPYAQALVEQLDSWLQQCPFGVGMNWRSPLELAIRLINWVWALDLIHESGLLTGNFGVRVSHSVYLHLWEITRKYSQSSSANNHFIGEAAGVFIAASYFDDLPGAQAWREESWQIIADEIAKQTYADGGGREQALGYQLFVLQFFLSAGLVARHIQKDFPAAYWSCLERMIAFIGMVSEAGGATPLFGDCDDGYVLNLGETHGDCHGPLAIGALLFDRADFKAWGRGCTESARWLLGKEALQRYERLASLPPETPLVSRAFPDSGYYLLQYGQSGTPNNVSVMFDCGELGFGSLAAHGHADALSFTLRAFGVDIFVDPGTYDYFTFPEWRTYFRSTRAHNTVEVDKADQSVMLGSFLWGDRAQARCLTWEPAPHGGRVTGEHDGYARLDDPVTHRRTLALDGQAGEFRIQDEILANGEHEVAFYFHLAEHCSVVEQRPNCYEIRVAGGVVTLEFDARLSTEKLSASETPIGGWVSRGYHLKAPSTTLVGRGSCRGTTAYVCRITIQ
jgi:hypothetical protein